MILKRFRPPIDLVAPYIKENINSGKNVRLAVTGNSMFPLLRGNRDSVVLSKPHNLSKYDVVLYRRKNGQYVFHRIISVKDKYLIIAGDAETKKEYPVYESDCIGKMISFERRGKLHYTDEFAYRIYSKLWLVVFPLRKIIIICCKKGRRLLLKIITRSNG